MRILKIKIIPEIELQVDWSGGVYSSLWPSESVGLMALTSRLLVHGSRNSGQWPFEVRTMNWVIEISENNEQQWRVASGVWQEMPAKGGWSRSSLLRSWVGNWVSGILFVGLRRENYWNRYANLLKKKERNKRQINLF